MSIFKVVGISFEVKLKIKKMCLHFVKNWPHVAILCQNNHRCKPLGKKPNVSHCPALALCWHRHSLRSRILKRILPKPHAISQNFSSPQWNTAGLFQQLQLRLSAQKLVISTMCSHLNFIYTVMTVYEHEMCIWIHAPLGLYVLGSGPLELYNYLLWAYSALWNLPHTLYCSVKPSVWICPSALNFQGSFAVTFFPLLLKMKHIKKNWKRKLSFYEIWHIFWRERKKKNAVEKFFQKGSPAEH